MSLLPSVLLAFLCLSTNLAAGGGQDTSDAPPEPVARPRYAWEGEPTPAERRLGGLLRAARRAESQPAALITALAAGGTAEIEAALEVLVRAAVPPAGPKDAPQMLSEPQRELLLSALSLRNSKDVLAALTARLGAEPDPEARLAALHALGAVGGRHELAALAQLAPHREDGTLQKQAKLALRGALVRLLQRDPCTFDGFDELLAVWDDACVQQLVEALGERRERRALPLLYEVARTRPTLAALAIATVRRTGRSVNDELAAEFSGWLVERIDTERPDWTRNVLYAIGELDDGAAVGRLIDLLGSPHPAVVEGALAALRRSTGLAFPAVVDAWAGWHARELAWHESQRPRLRNALSSPDPLDAAAGLRAYSQSRLYRRELAAEVAVVLRRPEPALQEAACATLADLGACGDLPALLDLLQSDRPDVRKAAAAALRTLTGLPLSGDADEARALVLAR